MPTKTGWLEQRLADLSPVRREEVKALAILFMPQAKRFARAYVAKLPFQYSYDEIESAAYVGAVRAAISCESTYSPCEVNRFVTKHVRSSVVDYLRSTCWFSWVPRSRPVRPVYLDDCAASGQTVAQLFGRHDDGFDDVDRRDEVEFLLSRLKPVQRCVVMMHYAGLSPREIGEVIERSPSRAYQILLESLSLIRAQVARSRRKEEARFA